MILIGLLLFNLIREGLLLLASAGESAPSIVLRTCACVQMYPPDFVNQLPLNDMSVTTPPGRTHMYYTGEAEFTFGAGLSYSNIALEMASVAPSTVDVTKGASELEYSINIRHVSGPAGKQTVLAFWKPRNPKTTAGQVPLKQKLFGYANVFLMEGMETTLRESTNEAVHPADL